MADDSARTKMLRDALVDEDMGPVKRAVKSGAVKVSEMLDRLGMKQEKEYEGKTKEEMAIKKAGGGMLKDVDAESNPGLSKLPEAVRNKMGYKRSGGKVSYKSGGKVSSASKRADGIAQRGKTRGKIV